MKNTPVPATVFANHAPWRRRHSHPVNIRGLTLVELLVAITLMLLVTIATTAIYISTSQSHRTVDASQQLDDSARFAFKLFEGAIQNAGYSNWVPMSAAAGTVIVQSLFADCNAKAGDVPCPVLGFDNSRISADSPYGKHDTNGINNSDSLALRFYGSGPVASSGDGNMISCTGQSMGEPRPGIDGDLGMSLFWVRNDVDGEPSLACTSNAWSPLQNAMTQKTETIVRGIESLQVMYGVDIDDDGVADRFVSARDVVDASGAGGWTKVKSVRVGLLLRGSPGSQQAADGKALYPLGQAFVGNGASGSLGEGEAGLKFTPPKDGRMRRVYISTFMLRNAA